MHQQLRIAALPIFLIAGLLFLWIAFPTIKNQLTGASSFKVVQLDLSRQLAIPAATASKNETIKVYNQKYQLYYSLNGGDHFHKAPNNELSISKIVNPPLLYNSTSIRWRHPKGTFETLKSVVLKLRNENEKIESKPVSYLFYDSLITPLPVIHITSKTSDLFGWQNGIMNYGEASSQDDGFYKEWWYRSANFAKRGSNSGRKVEVKLIEGGEEKFSQWCEMRISGNATRYFPQKSLKFFPLEANGKRGKIDFPIWKSNGAKKSESFLLRQSGNDNNRTLFADLLMHKLAKDSKVLVQDGYPVSVFINGNYWGIYNLRERIDPYFIAKATNKKAKEITVLYCEMYGDRTQLKDGKEAVKAEFDALIANLPTNRALTDKEYGALKEKISMKSFIDYIFFETFYANQDWLYNNTTWYKAANQKWKWVLNDLDYSLAYPDTDNLNANLFEKLKTKNSITGQLFSALIDNSFFNKKFKKRVAKMLNERLTEEQIDKTANELKKYYEYDIDAHIRRWRFIDNLEQWEKDCAQNITFLKERRKIYQKQVDSL